MAQGTGAEGRGLAVAGGGGGGSVSSLVRSISPSSAITHIIFSTALSTGIRAQLDPNCLPY